MQAKVKAQPKVKSAKPVLAAKKVAVKKPVVKSKITKTAAVKKAVPKKNTAPSLQKKIKPTPVPSAKPVAATLAKSKEKLQSVAPKKAVITRKKERIQRRKPVAKTAAVKISPKKVLVKKRRETPRPKKELSTVQPKIGKKSIVSAVLQGKTPLLGPKYFFSNDIPDRYNETYMRALPRDPFWIFAFWEFTPQTIKGIQTVLGEQVFASAKWILRVSDITDIEFDGNNAWRFVDLDIPFNADNWYVKVWEPGRLYLIQVGLMLPTGTFFEALRSNQVAMPRTGVSAITDEEWTTADTEELIRLSTQSLRRSIGASERLEETDLLQNTIIGGESGLGSGSGSGAIA